MWFKEQTREWSCLLSQRVIHSTQDGSTTCFSVGMPWPMRRLESWSRRQTALHMFETTNRLPRVLCLDAVRINFQAQAHFYLSWNESNQLSTCSWHRRNRRFCEHRTSFFTVLMYIYIYILYIYIFGFPKKWGYPKMPKRKHGWWTGVAGSPIFKWSQKMLKWETPQETMGPSDPIGAPDHPGSPRPMHCEAGSGSIKITICY